MTGAHCQTSYEVLLMEYAAGTLDLAQMLIVSAHLSMSPQARKLVKDCECVGGALMEKHCPPVAMKEGSLESVLGRLDGQAPQQTAQARRRIFPEDVPMPICVEEYIVCSPGSTLHWKSIYPGIHSFALPLECRRSTAQVFRFDPGLKTPRHRHSGLELTLVLDGAFMDEDNLHRQGSLMVMDPQSEAHAPKACEDTGCVCITVSTGSLQMSNALMRLLSPFFRF